MPVSLSFEIGPTRFVQGPDGSEWTVLLRRGSAWPGWRWLDWVQDHVDTADPGAALLLLPLDALTVPSVLLRMATYTARRRRDWSVSVYRGRASEYRPSRALEYQVCPTRAAGVELAGQVSARLAAGWHPRQG